VAGIDDTDVSLNRLEGPVVVLEDSSKAPSDNSRIMDES
jgi:hypothetical protein